MNAGRSYDGKFDLNKALENHYNPELVMKKLKEVHDILGKDNTPETGHSDEDLERMGYAKGYNLTAWMEIPGEMDSTGIKKLMQQIFTGGRSGFVTGPGYSFRKEAEFLRSNFL